MEIKQVLGNRILVKQIVPEVKDVEQDGVIVSADSINPNYFVGEIISIGHDCTEMQRGIPSFALGSRVAYLKYGYEDMGDNQHIVETQSLLAVIE